jgi:selenide, water dikinase
MTPEAQPVRLTKYASGGGCAAKLRLAELRQVLNHLPARPGALRPEIIVDHEFSDDAAIVRAAADRDLVLTADVIAPLVDDPAMYGAIAATNAMSDVWAMGGEPRFALNLVFFPDDVLPLAVLDAILDGAMRACEAAGVAVVGGHSVRDPEVKFGLSVVGEVARDALWSNRTAAAGQTLVLTKALGTGVIGQAIKKGAASEAAAAAAIRSMTTLNQDAARIGHAHGATAATDITGFGLLGHLRNVLRGSGVAATIDLAALPLLPGATEYMRAKVCPAGSKANRAHVAPDTAWSDGTRFGVDPVDDSDREVLGSLACDAQTSGGLLLCLPAANGPACVEELRAAGLPAATVGSLRALDGRPEIELRHG